MKCTICGKDLRDNEMRPEKGLFKNNPNKLVASNRFLFKCDGAQGEPKDLCFPCARKVRDYIEDLKEKSTK